MLRGTAGRAAATLMVAFVAACGSTQPVAYKPSPTVASPSSIASPSPSPSASPTNAPTNAPTPSPHPTLPAAAPGVRLVITDYAHNQVRLAALNAVDTAAVTGQFDGVVSDHAIVLNGPSLVAISSAGTVETLGQLAGVPEWTGPGTVAVDPSLAQWIYTIPDSNWATHIHLGTPTGDRVIATVASPDGYDFYQAFTWNASGAYLVKQGTGLGGVGPFLEYHFPLARLNVASGQVTMVSPTCIAELVLGDGTMLCRNTSPAGSVEVRSPSGPSHVIQVSTGSTASDGIYGRLSVSPDGKRLIADRNGSQDPQINFQMAVAALTASSATTFGNLDFWPDTWLPDGRVVADHFCWTMQGNGGACDQSLDGTYIYSADGLTRTLFYKLAGGSSVVAYL